MAKIVVGIDGSKGAQRALEWALLEAARRDADLQVVYAHLAHPLPAYVVGRAGGYAGPTEEQQRMLAEQVIDEALSAAGGPADVSVERTPVLDRDAAAALIDHSRDAELLVVGSRGLGGFAGLLLGSVSHQCVSHAHCPTVVVPEDR